jgi:hypothetical protein
MTYKMQVPLITRNTLQMNLADSAVGFSLIKDSLNNTELSSMMDDKGPNNNIYSSTSSSPSTYTSTAMPIATPAYVSISKSIDATMDAKSSLPLSKGSSCHPSLAPFPPIREKGGQRGGNLNLVHSNISGIKLKLGGRLEKTRIIPRRSSQELLIGNMNRGSITFKQTSRLTYKNKRGAYSLTVSSSYFNHTNPFTSRS